MGRLRSPSPSWEHGTKIEIWTRRQLPDGVGGRPGKKTSDATASTRRTKEFLNDLADSISSPCPAVLRAARLAEYLLCEIRNQTVRNAPRLDGIFASCSAATSGFDARPMYRSAGEPERILLGPSARERWTTWQLLVWP